MILLLIGLGFLAAAALHLTVALLRDVARSRRERREFDEIVARYHEAADL